MNLDGSGLHYVSVPVFEVNSAQWSPDGERIIMDCNSGASWDLYTSSADGSDFTVLPNTAAPANNPVWSPDGKRIAFVTTVSGHDTIGVLSADGGTYTNILEHLPEVNAFDNTAPDWCPDGGRIAFVSADGTGQLDIYIVNSDGTGLMNLTRTATAYEDAPRWAPDGKRIAFRSRASSGGNNRIRIMAADDGTILDNGADYGGRENSFSWSPDGKRIVFSTNRDGGSYKLYIMNADHSGLIPMTQGSSAEQNPFWGR